MTKGSPTDDGFELDEDELATSEPDLPAGTSIGGKYVIKRTLGSGGTGKVYEAEHTVIGHRVAIKIVSSERAARPETLARLQREARICGTIRHPNVGQIFDVGQHDGRPYMVLELHEGQSLAEVIDESILPLPAVVEITLQVLSALAAVHDVGVVHRDVKPDNAMLTRALNGDILVKLVDFGISKVMSADIRQRTLTREGSILGSPDYMAPEQLRGQEVDPRTDLYAVGVLLYEAVTGTTPFDAANLSDLMAAILRDEVTPPRELRPECPAELEGLIMKALSRDPASRFQSATEMARELEQLRGLVRQLPNAGSAGLREPMPRRHERETRDRRAARERSAQPDEPAAIAATEQATTETDSVELRKRRRRAPIIAAVVAALVTLGVRFVLSSRDREPPEPPRAPEVQAATVAPADPAPVAAAPMAAAPEPAAASDAGETATATQREPRIRTPKVKRPKADAPVASSEPPVKELLQEASSAFVMGQMPRAKALYQEVLARAPNQADAWRGLGLVSSRMGQSNDARSAFERYLELRPSAADADRIREQLEKLR